jgi:hypothetical protein
LGFSIDHGPRPCSVGTNNANFGAGFTASKGWDPATGFGTPNFPAMLKYANTAVAAATAKANLKL